MNIDHFVGLPYREGGRGPEFYDCYGLVVAVFRGLRGIELPDWYQDSPGPQGASRAISAALCGELADGRSILVSEPADFDVAIVGSTQRPHHVGVFLAGGVLHAGKTFGSIWHPLHRFRAIYPNVEFYRWHP